MNIRPMTKDELVLYHEAQKVLSTPIKPNTNITILNYILSGRTEELKELIKQAKNK